jgi:hypothetical protein
MDNPDDKAICWFPAFYSSKHYLFLLYFYLFFLQAVIKIGLRLLSDYIQMLAERHLRVWQVVREKSS